VYSVSLPFIFINAPASATRSNLPELVNLTSVTNSFTVLDIIGSVGFVLGLLIETVADFQKFFFRNNPENKGKWCAIGKFSSWLPLLLALCTK